MNVWYIIITLMFLQLLHLKQLLLVFQQLELSTKVFLHNRIHHILPILHLYHKLRSSLLRNLRIQHHIHRILPIQHLFLPILDLYHKLRSSLLHRILPIQLHNLPIQLHILHHQHQQVIMIF